MTLDMLDRAAAKFDIDPSGCWRWTAAIDSGGYGNLAVRIDGRLVARGAHRLLYEALVGPIPEGLQVDHICHTDDLTCEGGPGCVHRRCVNPDHMEPVTQLENIRRGRSRGRAMTHCHRGHPFDEANTYHPAAGGRICKTCSHDNTRRYRAIAKAERGLDHQCRNGHERTPENTYEYVFYDESRGIERVTRMCRACRTAAVAAFRARKQVA